jgi:hypothetical protein
VFRIELLCSTDVLVVPAIPRSRLISAQQHDEVPAGIEREQNPNAPINSRLLELVQTRAVYDVSKRPPHRGTTGQDPLDPGVHLRPAFRVKRVPPALEVPGRDDAALQNRCRTPSARIDTTGH